MALRMVLKNVLHALLYTPHLYAVSVGGFISKNKLLDLSVIQSRFSVCYVTSPQEGVNERTLWIECVSTHNPLSRWDVNCYSLIHVMFVAFWL